MNANSTHPDAKPRDQREHDELVWFHDQTDATHFCIVNGNGFVVAEGLSFDVARHLVRTHNAAVLEG